MDAISQLPLLENIRLTFLERPSNIHQLELPNSTLSKLKSLSMHFTCLRYHDPIPWELSNAKRTIYHLIANSPALEHLEVGPPISYFRNSRDPLDLDNLLVDLQARSNFSPSLRSFSPGATKFPCLNAMGFLKQLSCLEDPNDREEDQPVWPALQATGIKLATVKIKALTSELIEYLHTYHGLCAFHVHDIHVPNMLRVLQSDVILRLLTYVLPEHSTTLSDLQFYPSQGRSKDSLFASMKPSSMLWDISGLLRYIQPFHCLERLTLVHYTDDMSDENQRKHLVSTSLTKSCIHSVPYHQIVFDSQCHSFPFTASHRYLLEACRRATALRRWQFRLSTQSSWPS